MSYTDKTYLDTTACILYSNVPERLLYLNVPVQHLFEQYAIGFVGPFPVSKQGNKYILVAVEMFSRWPLARAVVAAEANKVASFLYEEIFCVFGPFIHLLSDNGTHFDAQIIDTFLALMQVNHKFTSGYRPQCNGMVEKLNGTLTRASQKLSVNDAGTWDVHLPSVIWAYCTKVHNTLKILPYQMPFGQDPSFQNPIMALGNELGWQRYAKLVIGRDIVQELRQFQGRQGEGRTFVYVQTWRSRRTLETPKIL
ncbi:hypothetical protein [Parasitella parasitica]|uniref:Integrase catalytic domain-containing protein n=1 Tax=Parasitella parasitica TaxID=35722 RepID=A0A0B7MYQ6_9FUNG|nr:hypothetical protein [Parasitella parasitica]